MTPRDAIRATANSGLQISRARLMDAIRASTEREFYFVRDAASNYAIVRIKIPD